MEDEEQEVINKLTEISYIDETRARTLYQNGINDFDDLLKVGVGGLTVIDDISITKAAEILEEADELSRDEKGVVETLIKDVDEFSVDRAQKDENADDKDFERIVKRSKEDKKTSTEREPDQTIAGDILKDVNDLKEFPVEEEVEGIAEELIKNIEDKKEESERGIAESLIQGVKDLSGLSKKEDDEKETDGWIAEDVDKGPDEMSDLYTEKSDEGLIEDHGAREKMSPVESFKSGADEEEEKDLSDERSDDFEEEQKPKRIIRIPSAIIKERGKRRPGITEALPVVVSFLIPVFLMLFVGAEFIIALLSYPTVTPASTIYYLTPAPYFQPFWISSLTLSFLVILGLFIPTVKGYDFSSGKDVQINKRMISVSAFFSFIVTISLALQIYHRQPGSGDLLTLSLLLLIIFGLFAQFELLRRKETLFPFPSEMKECPECAEKIPLDENICSRCGTLVADTERLAHTDKTEIQDGLVEEELDDETEEEHHVDGSEEGGKEETEDSEKESQEKEDDAESWMADIEDALGSDDERS